MKRLALILALVLCLTAFVGCGEKEDAGKNGEASADAVVTEGTAEGFGGELKVKVTREDDKITAVEVVEHSESVDDIEEVKEALETIPAAIVEANSTDVDAVAGATITSDAIKAAVDAAIAE